MASPSRRAHTVARRTPAPARRWAFARASSATAEEQRLSVSSCEEKSELPHGVGDDHVLGVGRELRCKETSRFVEKRGTGIGWWTRVYRDQIYDRALIVERRQDEAVGDAMTTQGTLGIAREGGAGIQGTIADAVRLIRSTCCMPIAVSASVAQPSASRPRAKSTISRSSGAVMGGCGSGCSSSCAMPRNSSESRGECGMSGKTVSSLAAAPKGPSAVCHGVHPVTTVARQHQVMRRQRGNQGRQDRGRLNYSNTWDTVLG
jgi:hypothetical protein